jgi:hypothetical protein
MISISALSPFAVIAMPGIPDRHGPELVIAFPGIRNNCLHNLIQV